VSKVGAWVGEPDLEDEETLTWGIPVAVRNGSELPVQVDAVNAAIRRWGYDDVLAAPEGTTKVDYYAEKRFGARDEAHLAPGTVAPGETVIVRHSYQAGAAFDQSPMVSVTRVVITDAAGYQWEMRSGRAGPARRVRQWRRWWWKRHGSL